MIMRIRQIYPTTEIVDKIPEQGGLKIGQRDDFVWNDGCNVGSLDQTCQLLEASAGISCNIVRRRGLRRQEIG